MTKQKSKDVACVSDDLEKAIDIIEDFIEFANIPEITAVMDGAFDIDLMLRQAKNLVERNRN